ncbi:hypothetical protein THRCLA_04017 [Thraustotheca clavata]|uniref:Transmembrane protein n=1 Tax=Thraustotheca clavata TaxID=74557 RepID=A0A1W0A049_9STRA|nr:hypothetical protein THRCLA_04017 [Thraustotheca clavata]
MLPKVVPWIPPCRVYTDNKEIAVSRRNICIGSGLVLCSLYVVFASTVALTTYTLNSIANTPTYIGLSIETFTSDQFNIPVMVLLQENTAFNQCHIKISDETLSLGELLYQECADDACAAQYMPLANKLWTLVGQAFAIIDKFDQTIFQLHNQTIHVQHINNLSGWNKATAQYYIEGYNMAITCMVRRASFHVEGRDESTVDSLAFCSERVYDPNWMCENEVGKDVNTYAIQMSKGNVSYIGVTKRSEVYMNPGAIAKFTEGDYGPISLKTIPTIDEYEHGNLQAIAPWDVLPAGDCSTYNHETKLGWLLQIEGQVTLIWKCDFPMITNSIVLWCIVFYLATIQRIFLPNSGFCTIPVYMSKSLVGIAVLVIAFWSNGDLQTLSTFIYQNASFGLTRYALCGPAQLASIVAIMTGTLIQMWFTPRIVTQTWILLIFSSINWILVFVLEYFVFPVQSTNIVSECGLATSSNCFVFSAIPNTKYISAIVSGSVVVIGIVVVYIHNCSADDGLVVPPTNSVLRYFKVTNITDIATTAKGCVHISEKDILELDEGILIVKNMLHVSPRTMTRSNYVFYGLIYYCLPTRWLKRYYSNMVGTILTIHIDANTITRISSYQSLDEINLENVNSLRGYLS